MYICMYKAFLWHKVINDNFYHRQQSIFQTFTFRKRKHTSHCQILKKKTWKKANVNKAFTLATVNATDFGTF